MTKYESFNHRLDLLKHNLNMSDEQLFLALEERLNNQSKLKISKRTDYQLSASYCHSIAERMKDD